MKKNKKNTTVFITRNQSESFITVGPRQKTGGEVWKWGDDNLFPLALAALARRSAIHRRILNDKADYISGKGFAFDKSRAKLTEMVDCANGSGESLRMVLNKLAMDKVLFGNAFLEVVSDPGESFLSLFHQDASRCRVGRDGKHIVMHHNWSRFKKSEAVQLPLFPDFEKAADGTIRSVIHYKEYEPGFSHYGVPSYVAGMNVSAIAYKTDDWNISRLDNSFQLSGVMLLDGAVDNEAQAAEIVKAAETKFAGKPGQVMFVIRDPNEADHSRFLPITSTSEGDWKDLHDQALGDIVVAHSWFRSLSGLEYSAGFNAERLLHEYEVALNTMITGQQEELMEPIRVAIEYILKVDTSSLQIVNRPPASTKPAYMKIWEARKADGLDYDPEEPAQQAYLAQLSNSKLSAQ